MMISEPKKEIVIALVSSKLEELTMSYALIEGCEIIECKNSVDSIKLSLSTNYVLTVESTFGFSKQVYSFNENVSFAKLTRSPISYLVENAIVSDDLVRYDPIDVRNYLFCYIDSYLPLEGSTLSSVLNWADWFMANVYDPNLGIKREFNTSSRLMTTLANLTSVLVEEPNMADLLNNIPRKATIVDYIVYTIIQNFGNLNS